MSHFDILLSGPVAAPAHCGICGYGGAERKYTDTRKDFEFYGAFIICEECVGAMANDYGFLQPHESANLLARLEANETELVTLRAAILSLEELHDAFDRLGLVRRDSVPDSVASVEPAESDGVPEVADSTEGLSVERPAEQDSEPRPDDVSDSFSAAVKSLSI